MRYDTASRLEDVIWQFRIADLPRAENRAILQRLYNGNPPFNEDEAEENAVQVNRNDLTGPNRLTAARNQWNAAFLGTKNFFTVSLDSGPAHKRSDWGGIITRHINRALKRNPKMREQVRSTGGNVMLHGIGPCNWKDRYTPVPTPIPVASLMVPSETDIDFDNLEVFSVFREWTPAQLYEMTHGPRIDPGWSMPVVKEQLKYVAEQTIKQVNATAFQYMPERIEEMVKQDLGFWGSDAVPTIDVWDTYFREAEDGKGWYRRILLDWGVTNTEMQTYSSGGTRPKSRNGEGADARFLYTSGDRKYAKSLSEILHCNFGDTSCYFPPKYHSVRSLGWMLWGPCDLQNQAYCKLWESTFMNMMWWFRVSGEQAFNRIKRADFFHMGVIPNGVSMIPAAERFSPDSKVIEYTMSLNEQRISENSASFTQDWAGEAEKKEMKATEVMARVNATNALVSGMLTLAYSYEESKYREICRRFCIRNSPDPAVRAFRVAVLKEGVPPEMLDVDRWGVEAERTIGGGNKTVEMAMVQGLNGIRKNLPPEGQRLVDHISAFAFTDQADLAEVMAPINAEKPISDSMHDAQLSTAGIMLGLPFIQSPKMVIEDYVKVWLADMGVMIQQATQQGNMATAEQIRGWGNLAAHIEQFLQQMEQNEDDAERVRQYQTTLTQLMNLVRGFAQRLAQQMKKAQAQPGSNGDGAAQAQSALIKAQGAVQAATITATAKAKIAEGSHAQRTAQKQIAFELQEQRKDRQTQADIRREHFQAGHELALNRLKALSEPVTPTKEPNAP